MIRKNIVYLSFILLSLFFVSTAQAFSISPLKYFYTLAPGDKQDILVTIRNDEAQSKEFTLSVTGLKQDKLGHSLFQNGIDLAENWIENNNQSIILGPHSSQDLIFHLSVPKSAAPGAHYLGLGAQEKNNQSIGGQLLTLVIFQVSGTAQESLELQKIALTKNIYFDTNWSENLQLKNAGNIELELKGKMKVNGPFYSYFQNSINFGNKLFAQSEREINLKLNDSPKWIWPGHYRAQVIVAYGLSQQTLVVETSFWYFPMWMIIFFSALLIIIIVRLIFKRVKNEVAV